MTRILVALLLTLLTVSAASAQSTVTANIHNACGWEPSTTYTYTAGPPSGHFLRVNNGAGWTPSDPGVACGTGTWNAGSALNNYQLIAPTTGTCQSAASGGPSGTGSSITDNTCTWKYVSSTDYISITGWAFDSGKVWTSGTNYGTLDVVHTLDTNLPVFQQFTAGCRSTVKPTTSNINTTLSDGCYWTEELQFLADTSQHYLYYTSNANVMPMSQMWFDSLQGSVSSASYSATVTIASNVATVSSPSGFVAEGSSISGTGIVSGQYLYQQLSGTAGGAGTYSLGVSQSNVTSPTAISGTFGELTITTPPATYPVATLQFINYPGIMPTQTTWSGPNANPSYIATWQQIDSTHWTLAVFFFGTPTPIATLVPFTSSPTNPIFLADEQHGTTGSSYQFSVGDVWNDQEYVSAQNHESNIIEMWNNNYQYDDTLSYLNALGCVYPSLNTGLCADYSKFGYPTVIQAAPGEGFASTFAANPGMALTGYDANNGVAIRGVGVDAFGPQDSMLEITGLQFKSDTGMAIDFLNRAGNAAIMDHDILEGGSSTANYYVTNSGAEDIWFDDLIVAHGIGIFADYGGWVYSNTFVCPTGSTCPAAIIAGTDWINANGTIINNNLVFGFTHFTGASFYNNQYAWSSCTWNCVTVQGLNDATDNSSTDGQGFDSCSTATQPYPACTGFSFPVWIGGSFVTGLAIPFKTGYTYFSSGPPSGNLPICGFLPAPNNQPVAGVCGITNSVSPSATFASWPGNYNILNSSVAYGGGAAASTITFCTGTWFNCTLNPNTPDLVGTTRPQGSRFDMGAIQSVGATGVSAGRPFFR